ncbi:hypothetical protein A3844_28680 [Paenibacillus helianthi]|uniref:Erythromycin biosynthesis protein CIII-like C-terminal domain-containing protein n=1 Tax=Paenibacillus helianthi TaxID=1349432 RepID=A0ABX3EF65_9BACL|nr:macrolide family glycosyltransferase [Paenibacillus helianthi]OKP79505.1 hypothetical protein A3844_28680 [Paenibacillus helianthi]
MSNVLLIGFPLFGHMRPLLGLSRLLVQHGETVYFFGNENFREAIENSGALFLASEEEYSPSGSETAGTDKLSEFAGLLLELLQARERLVPVLNALISSSNIDYIIHDSFCSWGKMTARINRLPAVSSITTFGYNQDIYDKYPEQFIQNVLLMPTDSPNALFPKQGRAVQRMLKLMFAAMRDLTEESDDLIDLLVNKQELNFVYTSSLFQIHMDSFDSSFRFVGPLIKQTSFSDHTITEQADADKRLPLIYISFGTVFNHKPQFYAMCIEAFRDFNGRVVISTGNVELDLHTELPCHIELMPWVSQQELLRLTTLFITHGGFNSINEALFHDVPVIVIPRAVDQFLVAERVEQLGVGMKLELDTITPHSLASTAKEVLESEEIKSNCRLVGESLRLSGGLDEVWVQMKRFKQIHEIR